MKKLVSSGGELVPLQRGQHINHRDLGECQVREVHDDGSITVCTVEVKGGMTNMFRLRPPQHPSNWVAYRE